MIRLSIIIPFYNVEQYIAQCLDSVYNQDIPEEEYEVICVNDASPDGSREIVKEYQKKHKNLILVEHEVNKKLGAARNTGRRVAKGKYIWNVDSDDQIAPNCLKAILHRCEKHDLDVLLFGYQRMCGMELLPSHNIAWELTNKVLSGIDFWKREGSQKQGNISQVWTQVYKRSYLDEKAIYSPEINMSEDVPYAYASILLAKRLSVTNTPYYIYRDNAASLSQELRSTPTPKTVYENCFVCSKCLEDVCKHIRHGEKEAVLSIRLVENYILLSMWKLLEGMSKEDMKQLQKICRRNFWSNLYVFKVLGRKNSMQYLQFVLK